MKIKKMLLSKHRGIQTFLSLSVIGTFLIQLLYTDAIVLAGALSLGINMLWLWEDEISDFIWGVEKVQDIVENVLTNE